MSKQLSKPQRRYHLNEEAQAWELCHSIGEAGKVVRVPTEDGKTRKVKANGCRREPDGPHYSLSELAAAGGGVFSDWSRGDELRLRRVSAVSNGVFWTEPLERTPGSRLRYFKAGSGERLLATEAHALMKRSPQDSQLRTLTSVS